MTADTTGRVAVRLSGVTKAYGSGGAAVVAVKDTTLEIFDSEFFTLLGPSGCGKTTILRLIGGFEFPTSGTIRLHGEDIAAVPPFKRRINTVFQNYALFPHMTVSENIAFGLRMLKRPRPQIAKRVGEMLALVRLEHLADRRTHQLSGGQQQRVALARALASEPEVLLLDEPLSALDYKLRKEMQEELKSLQTATGVTFIFVTHDQEEAFAMSDRVAVLCSGEVMQIGTPSEIYEAPRNRFVANFVGETNLLEGRCRSSGAGGTVVNLDELGEVVVLPLTGLADGEKVNIVVRPEHIKIDAVREGRTGPSSGVVKSVKFCGCETQYRVEVEGGATNLMVREYNSPNEPHMIKVGDRVSIAFVPNAARMLLS